MTTSKQTKYHKDHPLLQLIRYGIVGVMNTLLTLVVIFLCKSYFGINPYVSNAIGYACGVTNSFLWNKQWVFHSKGKFHHEAAIFFTGCLLCYGVQLLVVWLINKSWFGAEEFNLWGVVISGYGVATLIGNVVYTICNFTYNRVVTFRKRAA